VCKATNNILYFQSLNNAINNDLTNFTLMTTSARSDTNKFLHTFTQ